MSAWNPSDAPASLGGGVVTMVEGSSFCVCATSGDIAPDRPHGVLVRDTRVVSLWQLTLDDESPEPLGFFQREPFGCTFVARTLPRSGRADSTLLVLRRRYVGDGMREDIVLRNLSDEPAGASVELAVDADFADLFEVKDGRIRRRGKVGSRVDGRGALVFELRHQGSSRASRVSADGAAARAGALRWDVVVPRRGEWTACVEVRAFVDGHEVPPRYPCGSEIEQSTPAQRLRTWRRDSPHVTTSYEPLDAALSRSGEDLGALRIFAADQPDRAVVAAGAPWFMTVFGRDSLLTSWMCLMMDPTLAAGTLQTLAGLQGTRVDPLTEEEPGRILHEMRFGVEASRTLGGSVYYGTADATPLFVMLLGELRRWGLGRDLVDELLPHADRAIAWIEEHGDRDGDGFVEYLRTTDRGLRNQGWKDSWDGVNFASGRIAEPPIALCEVQGYVYAAYLARAYFAEEAGDAATAQRLQTRAAALKQAFNERFWLPDRGYYAIALDGDKRPVDALTSNIGHCLWTGIVDEDKARSVADRLLSAQMWTGWGVRTLGADMGAYNPISYHNGSVWPHDNAIVAAGLMRYGFVEEAQRIAVALLEAAEHFGGRLPELFCGLDRAEFPTPIPYPTSCSPQAWAAAAPVQLLRTLLRLDPWIPRSRVWLSPALPAPISELRVEGIPLAGARVDVEVCDGRIEVGGLPANVELVDEARHPLTAAFD